MEKRFFQSMTFWGTVLLSVEAALKVAGTSHPTIQPYLTGLGVFLTAFGFRKAMK